MLAVALAVEAALHAAHGGDSRAPAYKAGVHLLATSLKRPDLAGLRRDVLAHRLAPADLVAMRREDMAPDDLRAKLDAAKKAAMFEAQAAKNIKVRGPHRRGFLRSARSVADDWRCTW